MSGKSPRLTIRAMTAADIGRVMEIAEGLKDAPHWPPTAYESALDENALPRRIALVAEWAKWQSFCAGARSESLGSLSGLKPPSASEFTHFEGEAETLDRGVVGFVMASCVAPHAELESIAVAAEWQRRGVARRLFGELRKKLAEDWGATDVLLEVRAGNGSALALYHGLGFVEDGRRRGYYADPVEDAILLKLKLR